MWGNNNNHGNSVFSANTGSSVFTPNTGASVFSPTPPSSGQNYTPREPSVYSAGAGQSVYASQKSSGGSQISRNIQDHYEKVKPFAREAIEQSVRDQKSWADCNAAISGNIRNNLREAFPSTSITSYTDAIFKTAYETARSSKECEGARKIVVTLPKNIVYGGTYGKDGRK